MAAQRPSRGVAVAARAVTLEADVEAGAVVFAEQAAHQVDRRVIVEVGREGADADAPIGGWRRIGQGVRRGLNFTATQASERRYWCPGSSTNGSAAKGWTATAWRPPVRANWARWFQSQICSSSNRACRNAERSSGSSAEVVRKAASAAGNGPSATKAAPCRLWTVKLGGQFLALAGGLRHAAYASRSVFSAACAGPLRGMRVKAS